MITIPTGMKGEHIWTLSIIALALIFGAASPAGAEENPPSPGPGGIYVADGDWVIESGEDVRWSSATIEVNGNLTVRSGGRLTLDMVALKMNMSVEAGSSVIIEEGGYLEVTNGIITSKDGNEHYKMDIYGSALLESTQISEVWGNPSEPWTTGLGIHSDDVIIRDCSFLNCRGNALHIYSSDPLIEGNRFYGNDGLAVYYDGSSKGTFRDNLVYDQYFGIFVSYYASPEIHDNEIFNIIDNGITLNGIYNPHVWNNTIYRCLNGILLWFSNALVENNEIYQCEAGIHAKVDSTGEIRDCTIRDNIKTGLVVNGSSVKVEGSGVTGNTFDGLTAFNGSRVEITDCIFRGNEDDGFQVTDSFVEVRTTTIEKNLGDSLFLRDGGQIDIYDSSIVGGQNAPDEFELNIGEDSLVKGFDVSFNKDSVHFGNRRSELRISTMARFSVTDPDMRPIPDLAIRTVNETGDMKIIGTDLEGMGSRYLAVFEQKDLNGDGDGKDPGELHQHSYNFTIKEEGYIPYSDVVVLDKDTVNTVVLEPVPVVRVIASIPSDGETDITRDPAILIRFDEDIDPSTLVIDLVGPGGMPVFFDLDYHPNNRTVEIRPTELLEWSSIYTLYVRDVVGSEGEPFKGPFTFTFYTVDEPEPDNDMDGVPDSIDDDDDNDGYKDTLEIYYGTDPFSKASFPYIPDPDDDDDDDTEPPVPKPDTEPDIDDDHDPWVPDDNDSGSQPSPNPLPQYDPVEDWDSNPGQGDGIDPWLLLVSGSILGIIILGVTLLMVFLGTRKDPPLKDGDK
ncbi:MAG: right-handed parallel beta-helix repeat-containing protein [Thermoplasmatota archaeon]